MNVPMKYEIPMTEKLYILRNTHFELHLHSMVHVENKNLHQALADTHSNGEHTHGHTQPI